MMMMMMMMMMMTMMMMMMNDDSDDDNPYHGQVYNMHSGPPERAGAVQLPQTGHSAGHRDAYNF